MRFEKHLLFLGQDEKPHVRFLGQDEKHRLVYLSMLFFRLFLLFPVCLKLLLFRPRSLDSRQPLFPALQVSLLANELLSCLLRLLDKLPDGSSRSIQN